MKESYGEGVARRIDEWRLAIERPGKELGFGGLAPP
jgi:hypothetical protein